MWASVGGVLAPEKREFSEEELATADRVCAACATWDGSVEALAEMRFGDDWRVTMGVISRGEPCYADVMRVCEAIVRSEGHFISAYLGRVGAIYTDEAIRLHRGKRSGMVLTFPDADGMYRDAESRGGDPWDDVYEPRSAWRSAS